MEIPHLSVFCGISHANVVFCRFLDGYRITDGFCNHKDYDKKEFLRWKDRILGKKRKELAAP